MSLRMLRRPRICHTVDSSELRRGDHIYKYTSTIPDKDSALHGIFVGGSTCEVIYLLSDRVVRCRLEEFLQGRPPRVFQYGVSSAEHTAKKVGLGMTSVRRSQEPEQVAQVANWFAHHDKLFSKHWRGVCDSRSFATFCKTTNLTKEQLERGKSNLAHLLDPESCSGGSQNGAVLVLDVVRRGRSSVTCDSASGQADEGRPERRSLPSALLSAPVRAVLGGVVGGVIGGATGALVANGLPANGQKINS